jgi:lactoylglutathione lyase
MVSAILLHLKSLLLTFIFQTRYMKNILLAFTVVATCFTCSIVLAQNSNKPKAVINHLAIYVVDLQNSGDFYMNLIGLDSIPEPFHDGKHLWLRIGPKTSVHIIQGAEMPKEYYKNNHICFSVESVEAFTEILKKKNIPFEDLAGNKNVFSKRPDGVKQIWLRDPDGYWIEINDAKD